MIEEMAIEAIGKAALEIAAPKVAQAVANTFNGSSNLTLLNLMGRSVYTPVDDFPSVDHFVLSQRTNSEASYKCSLLSALNQPREPQRTRVVHPWHSCRRMAPTTHQVTILLGLTQAGPQSPNEETRNELLAVARSKKADFTYFVCGRPIDEERTALLLNQYPFARKIFKVTHPVAIPETIRLSNIVLIDDSDVFQHRRDDLNQFKGYAHYTDLKNVDAFAKRFEEIWQSSTEWANSRTLKPRTRAVA